MNEINNEITHVEAENVKLNDFNNKMYKICNKTEVFEKLEGKNMKELEEQKKVFAGPLIDVKESSNAKSRHGNKPVGAVHKSKEPKDKVKEHHCWFF